MNPQNLNSEPFSNDPHITISQLVSQSQLFTTETIIFVQNRDQTKCQRTVHRQRQWKHFKFQEVVVGNTFFFVFFLFCFTGHEQLVIM